MNLSSQIEAVLFFLAEPVKESELAQKLSVSEEEIGVALDELAETLSERGIRLIRKDGAASLATAPEAHELITAITQAELSKDPGKAGLETLSIILYRSPVSKSEIDYIRGVNSNSILRNLLVRGLIEKIPHPEYKRSVLYQPTFDLLAHLGVSTVEELPEYDTLKEQISAMYAQAPHENDTAENASASSASDNT